MVAEARETQEKLRLSNAHNNQLVSELNTFKERLQATLMDNQGLAGQVREGQEKLRLSASETAQLISQI